MSKLFNYITGTKAANISALFELIIIVALVLDLQLLDLCNCKCLPIYNLDQDVCYMSIIAIGLLVLAYGYCWLFSKIVLQPSTYKSVGIYSSIQLIFEWTYWDFELTLTLCLPVGKCNRPNHNIKVLLAFI